jgi:hypothetical protein
MIGHSLLLSSIGSGVLYVIGHSLLLSSIGSGVLHMIGHLHFCFVENPKLQRIEGLMVLNATFIP